MLDPQATPVLARRTKGLGLADTLFAMQIMGDDRTVARTYIMGHCAWNRESERFGAIDHA